MPCCTIKNISRKRDRKMRKRQPHRLALRREIAAELLAASPNRAAAAGKSAATRVGAVAGACLLIFLCFVLSITAFGLLLGGICITVVSIYTLTAIGALGIAILGVGLTILGLGGLALGGAISPAVNAVSFSGITLIRRKRNEKKLCIHASIRYYPYCRYCTGRCRRFKRCVFAYFKWGSGCKTARSRNFLTSCRTCTSRSVRRIKRYSRQKHTKYILRYCNRRDKRRRFAGSLR